jgi:hypothetical protein
MVKYAQEKLQADENVILHLNDRKESIYQQRSPDADMFPRIDIFLFNDRDGDFYDNRSISYTAEISLAIQDRVANNLYAIMNAANRCLTANGFTRILHRDLYEFSGGQFYVKEARYEKTVCIRKDGEIVWVI